MLSETESRSPASKASRTAMLASEQPGAQLVKEEKEASKESFDVSQEKEALKSGPEKQQPQPSDGEIEDWIVSETQFVEEELPADFWDVEPVEAKVEVSAQRELVQQKMVELEPLHSQEPASFDDLPLSTQEKVTTASKEVVAQKVETQVDVTAGSDDQASEMMELKVGEGVSIKQVQNLFPGLLVKLQSAENAAADHDAAVIHDETFSEDSVAALFDDD